jgi:hypothetical protein
MLKITSAITFAAALLAIPAFAQTQPQPRLIPDFGRYSEIADPFEKLGPVYQARVVVDRGKLGGRLEEGIALAPGLQATAEIRTSDRRVIDYLLSPIVRRLNEAGRER